MPTVVNGIGTWYYGKRRIHTRRGTCEFCGNVADLTSYDTTLFFVFVFIPLFPLSRKRILEQCALCQKHRVLDLAKWEEAKATDGVRVIDNLHNHPEDRDSILQAIGFASAYQDEPLFNELVVPLAGEMKNDAGIQLQLAEAHAYFAHWPQAEEAFRAVLTMEDTEPVRERLAWSLLKQGRPREARPYLQHIIDKKIADAAGTNYCLIAGYQAQGLHDEALALMDERDRAFPQFVNLKEYQKQRKISQRYRGSEKKISSPVLDEGKAGYRRGTWTSRLPGWIAASIALGLLFGYLGWAAWLGESRKVFLVNGTSQPYAVTIDGTEHTLPPGATPVRVAEGDKEIAFRKPGPDLEPVRCTIESSFWTRPFTSPTFVINPDRAALVVHEETLYAEVAPPPGKPPTVHFGQPFYSFSGLDYEFAEFPRTIQMKKGQIVTKTRVALVPAVTPEVRFNLMMQRIPDNEQLAFCKRLLMLDPSSSLFLYWLVSRLPAEQMLEFFKVHLEDQPLLVDWHRSYQSLMDRTHPQTDLKPRYEKLVAETKNHPDAVYLLGRVEPDRDKADKLFEQAAAGDPPSGHAMYALGYHALGEGRFADACRWLAKSQAQLADKTMVRQLYQDALLANGAYDRLLQELQVQSQVPGAKIGALTEIAKVHAIRGDKTKAQAALAEVVQVFPEQGRQLAQAAFNKLLRPCEKDVAGFLKDAAADPGGPTFEVLFLKGEFKEAAGLANRVPHDANAFHGLLYLAATRGGDKDLAKDQWQALLAGLAKGGRDERRFGDILAGRKPLPDRVSQQPLLDPRSKRVLWAVLAERQPEQAADLRTLAVKLDFYRDAVSLCLRRVLNGK